MVYPAFVSASNLFNGHTFAVFVSDVHQSAPVTKETPFAVGARPTRTVCGGHCEPVESGPVIVSQAPGTFEDTGTIFI
jgi:hypothetical protein